MNWDAIGAIAEMLAALGVIISLIFVGMQVRKGSAESRAATMQSTTDTEVAIVRTLAANADIWNKIISVSPLESGVETRKGILLFALLMIDYENRFHQHRAGYFDSRSWNGRVRILRKTVTLPIFDVWRQSQGGKSRGADYLEFLDKLVADVRSES